MAVKIIFPYGLLFLFVAIPFLAWVLLSAKQESQVLRAFLSKPSKILFLVESILVLAWFAALAVTLARPVIFFSRPAGIVTSYSVPVILVFDTGGSMAAGEPYGPSRLDRSRNIALKLFEHIEGQVGVAAFSNISVLHLFPTQDRFAVRETINTVVKIGSVPFKYPARTDLSAVARLTTDYFVNMPGLVMVIFTDGETDSAPLPQLADTLKKAGTIVFVVGVGQDGERIPIYDENGKFLGFDSYLPKFNGELLQQFAKDAQGFYFYEKDSQDLIDDLPPKIPENIGLSRSLPEKHYALELWPFFLFLATIFTGALLFLRRT